MPHVHRQLGQLCLDIGPLPIPAVQRLDGEAVAKIMNTRPMRPVDSWWRREAASSTRAASR